MMRYHSCDYITLSWGAQIQSGEPFESRVFLDFPGGPVVKHRPASAGDVGSITGPRRCRTLLGTKPTQHSHVLQLLKPGDPGACALPQERGHHSEKPGAPTRITPTHRNQQQQRPSTANKQMNKICTKRQNFLKVSAE